MFSTKHGLLTKAAIIVAQVSPDGKTNENWLFDSPNKTLVIKHYIYFKLYLAFQTWGQVQRFDIWSPYVAVETPIEPLKRFAPRPISEVSHFFIQILWPNVKFKILQNHKKLYKNFCLFYNFNNKFLFLFYQKFF